MGSKLEKVCQRSPLPTCTPYTSTLLHTPSTQLLNKLDF